jgi:hypothetical protein
MRSFAAFSFGVLAFVAALITVPTMWVSSHVAEEDGYVRLSSKLARDSQLQGAFAAYLSNELVARKVLPASLESTVTVELSRVAARETNTPGFVRAWDTTQRRFHRSAFADNSRPLAVDIGPLGQFVATRVSDEVPVTLKVPGSLTVPVGDSKDHEAVARVKETEDVSRLGLIVVVVASLGAVFIAWRRSTAVMWLGVGAVAVAALLWVGSNVAAPRILDHTEAPSEFARTLQKLLVDRATASLDAWLLWIAAGGAVVAVAGLAGRAMSGRNAD